MLYFIQSFERAMKFSANEPITWLQHALCLITSGKHAHGLAVLREATNQDPASVSPCLVAARACYEHLNLVNLHFPSVCHLWISTFASIGQ